jgi:hypothetical protein
MITSHYWCPVAGVSDTAGCAKRNLQGCLAASARERRMKGRTREGVEDVVLGSDHGVGGLVDVVLEWRR